MYHTLSSCLQYLKGYTIILRRFSVSRALHSSPYFFKSYKIFIKSHLLFTTIISTPPPPPPSHFKAPQNTHAIALQYYPALLVCCSIKASLSLQCLLSVVHIFCPKCFFYRLPYLHIPPGSGFLLILV